ncbi:hypothetical protein BU23DRAFT_121158 [Bimuria novae-zelandiae CBS 107.79]|uniref:Uncharacterized protein n=1 Tax=Bimuria novae-zelandiae CBS 107.79 TaxID=1447943 RepID=A0A6A5VG08_9PLEO|nr:hypothetical protein BU23DRAFT_121158 [Bimuria novae-zelandiae CBS 107.79]
MEKLSRLLPLTSCASNSCVSCVSCACLCPTYQVARPLCLFEQSPQLARRAGHPPWKSLWFCSRCRQLQCQPTLSRLQTALNLSVGVLLLCMMSSLAPKCHSSQWRMADAFPTLWGSAYCAVCWHLYPSYHK